MCVVGCKYVADEMKVSQEMGRTRKKVPLGDVHTHTNILYTSFMLCIGKQGILAKKPAYI